MYKLTSRPFNLTATVVSNLNLTSLHWSPEYPDQSPSRTITVRHGNITITTFMLLEDATLGDSGNYTLTAVNECGENSSQINVEVITGKINVYLYISYVVSYYIYPCKHKHHAVSTSRVSTLRCPELELIKYSTIHPSPIAII